MIVRYIILSVIFSVLYAFSVFVSRFYPYFQVELERVADDSSGESESEKSEGGSQATALVKSSLLTAGVVFTVLVSAFESRLFELLFTDKWASNALLVLSVSLLFVFSYIFPFFFERKREALEKMAGGSARVATFIFFPIAKPLSIVGEYLKDRIFASRSTPSMTQDELISVVDEIEESGDLSEDEGEIVRGAIKFADVIAQNILIPRVDIKAFDIDEPLEALLRNEELLSYSRIPVFKGDIDNIIGILNVRELAAAILTNGRESVNIEKLLARPYYVHMNRDLTSLLKTFREKGYQMAIVVDEYGGTTGIITAEDIFEEIVGDIFDEGDDAYSEYVKRAGGYEVDASMNLDDFFSLMEIDAEDFESEYNTVGGWTIQMLDKIPDEGDEFSFDQYDVKIIETDGNRVERILIVKREELE